MISQSNSRQETTISCAPVWGFSGVQPENPRASRADAGGAETDSTCQRPEGRRRPGAVFAAAKIGREKDTAPAVSVCFGGRSPASPAARGQGGRGRRQPRRERSERKRPPCPRVAGRPASLAKARSAAQRNGGNRWGKRRRPAAAGAGRPRQRAAEGAVPVDTTGAVERSGTKVL